MKTIPIERLRELVRLDPETGRIYWLKKANPKAPIRVGAECGCPSSNGYRQARIDEVTFLTHRVVWALAHGEWPSMDIDHINGIRDDNRPCNLRLATKTQNALNRPAPVNNSSGCRGVTRENGKWRVRIRLGKKKHHVGSYDDLEVAIAAYELAARHVYGEFAREPNQMIGE